jgi:hypothetical protein
MLPITIDGLLKDRYACARKFIPVIYEMMCGYAGI